MATYFGIEDRNMQDLIEKDIVCIPTTPDGKFDLHHVVSPIKSEDIVFIKHYVAQYNLQIRAVGVVKSDYPTGERMGLCMPVDWVWQGGKLLEHFDEARALRSDLIYEEHDIIVQMEINKLLPEKYRLPQEW